MMRLKIPFRMFCPVTVASPSIMYPTNMRAEIKSGRVAFGMVRSSSYQMYVVIS